jgi:hypothetical protein
MLIEVNLIRRSDRPTEDTQASKSPQTKSEHVDKLIQVYQKAKADYYILEVTESHRKRTNSYPCAQTCAFGRQQVGLHVPG